MNGQDYTVSITVNKTAEEAFNGITDIKGWWTTVFEKTGDVFTVRFGETFITIKVVESIPYQKIGWQVIDCHKHWLKDKKEWKDTTMNWEILATQPNVTQISFTHFGLVPGIECYNGCEKAWNFYIQQSLFKLLTEGKGIPNLK